MVKADDSPLSLDGVGITIVVIRLEAEVESPVAWSVEELILPRADTTSGGGGLGTCSAVMTFREYVYPVTSLSSVQFLSA